MMDGNRDISFVVQGPVVETAAGDGISFSTAEVLLSIRKNFPGAEIILSTWKGTNSSGLDYDKVIFNDDPGSIIIPHVPAPYNHNRLIRSSRNGIVYASHDLVVKTRSDLIFRNNAILDKLQYITPIKGPYTFFSHNVLSTNYYVRNPFRLHLLFHASDIILIGRKQDLHLFFSAPLVSKEEMVNESGNIKMVAEQYLTLNSIASIQKRAYHFEDVAKTNVRHFLHSEKYLFHNFLLFNIDELGIEFPSKLLFAFRPEANYSAAEAEILSRKYRKQDRLGIFSFARATRYFIHRLQLYLEAKKHQLRKKFSTN